MKSSFNLTKAKFTDLAKIDKNNFIEMVSDNFSGYLDFVKVVEKNLEIGNILHKIKKIPYQDFSNLISKDRINAQTNSLSLETQSNCLQLIEREYRTSFKVSEIFQKHNSLLNKNFKDLSLLFFPQKKSYYPVFISMILQIFSNENNSFENFHKEKINFEEISLLKLKIEEIKCQIKSISPKIYLPLFKVKSSQVLASMELSLDKINELIKGKLQERLITNTKVLSACYSTLILKLRMEIHSSADYAKFRKIAFEANQEKTILLKKNKDIIDELIYCLKTEVVDVGERDILYQIYDLSKSDSQFNSEIEKGTERVSLTRAEFERKLKEDKQIFQGDCDELYARIQVYKNLSDWRNYVNNYEELRKISVDLRYLKERYQDIDQQEVDLYERRFRTNDLDNLDEIILPNFEIWQFALETMSFIKKTFNTTVNELNLAEIQFFICETSKRIMFLRTEKSYCELENLKTVFVDIEQELKEFFERENLIEEICKSDLSFENWQEFVFNLDPMFEVSNLSLRVFISYYSTTNAATFSRICLNSMFNKNLKKQFAGLKLNLKNIRFEFQHLFGHFFISNIEQISKRVDELLSDYQLLCFEAKNNSIRTAIEELGVDIELFNQFAPLMRLFQVRVLQICDLFGGLDYSVEMEKEYRQFYQLAQIFDDLVENLRNEDFEFVKKNPELRFELKKQIAIAEIIINQKSSLFVK